MSCQLVFNLYPFSETLFLPSANLVQADKAGFLTHLIQKATPVTMAAFDLAVTPVLERLFERIDHLQPKSVEARFKPPKAKTPTPLAQLLVQADTKAAVEQFIHRELDLFLADIVRHRLPLTLDAERRTLVKDVLLRPATEELVPQLAFRKTDAGIEYRFQLGTDTETWNIRERDVWPLTNTSPAWVVSQYTLYRVPGINGNMLRPFRQKDLIQIPPDKVRTYFRQFIAKNASRTRIEAEGFAMRSTQQLQGVRLEPTENILENSWMLKPVFLYDGAEFPHGERRDRVTSLDIPTAAEGEITVHLVIRDAEAEQAKLAMLTGLGLSEDHRTFRLPGGTTLAGALEWLSGHRPGLEAAGFILELPQVEGRAIAVLPAKIQLRAEAAGDWFDIRGQVEIGEYRFPFQAFVPYIRRNDAYFPLPDGTFFRIPEEWFTRFSDLVLAAEANGPHTLRLRKSLFTLLQQAGLDAGENAAEAFPVIDPGQVAYQPAADLNATLRPYQLHGVKWLIGHYQHGFGACLADDMGLGKTLQTIAVLLHIKASSAPQKGEESLDAGGAQLSLFHGNAAHRPLQALVILPASLVFNWQRELAQFAPSLFVYPHTGPKRLKDMRAIAAHDVVLTTYHTARQDLELLGRQEWQAIVLDESQQIKNRDSEVSRVVRALRGRYKISLSGTPIENSLADLWTQMEFINPDTLGPFSAFREQFILPIERSNDEAAKQRLYTRVRPFFLRRTKTEVAPDLPALSDQVFFTEMSEAQRKRYEQVRSAVRNEILNLFDDPKTRILALQALTRLRQLANHPALADPDYTGDSGKFDDVLAQWETLRRAGHKVLFFSSFEKHLRLYRHIFEQEGQPFAWLTGDTPTDERARAVERFQTDPAVQAFFMTVKAGGVGLNLTSADYVFLLDPWWNPAAEDQAIARAHRIGQTRPVTALRFIARATIEEKIRQLQERKKQLGLEFFAAGAETPALTREDMEVLLG